MPSALKDACSVSLLIVDCSDKDLYQTCTLEPNRLKYAYRQTHRFINMPGGLG